MQDFDVVVVGGGIAGLCAASFATRTGARVILYEASSNLGGRARTRVQEEFHFNYGAHALYRGGELDTALQVQGVHPRGKVPNLAAGYFVLGAAGPIWGSCRATNGRGGGLFGPVHRR